MIWTAMSGSGAQIPTVRTIASCEAVPLFLNYLEAAENDPAFQAEIPAFVAEIKRIFEPWQLAEYLQTARQTEPFDPSIYEDADPEVVEMEGKAELRRCAADLLLVERAKVWLLDEEGK